uniref:Uncharacterized protein n=1 Tax=Neogobius melanostomus TaxID=47308 RepID=A0A8C6TMW8_9GOBI
MAAVDRRMPNLDDFVGLNWSCWVDRLDLDPPDDMPIYGHCPAQDDFYLVVCSHCGNLVKPQAFEDHSGNKDLRPPTEKHQGFNNKQEE